MSDFVENPKDGFLAFATHVTEMLEKLLGAKGKTFTKQLNVSDLRLCQHCQDQKQNDN